MNNGLAERFQAFLAGSSHVLDGVTEQDRFDGSSPLISGILLRFGIEMVQSRLLSLIHGGSPASLRAYELLAGYYFAWGEWELFLKLTTGFLPKIEEMVANRRMDEGRFTAWADAAIQIGHLSVAVNFQKLNSTRDYEIERLDSIYVAIADRLGRRAQGVASKAPGGIHRSAHCVDFVNSLNNAIVKEVDCILEYSSHDRKTYLLSTELCSIANRSPISLFRFASYPSAEAGRPLLAKWAAAGCGIRLFTTPDSYCERIVAMHRFIREEGIEVVLYHTGIASGMACVLSYLRPAPVQINAHQGLPMFSRAVTATRFWTHGQAERYRHYFDRRHAAFVMPAILKQIPRHGRSRPPGLPVCIATAGNRLPVMMDEPFVALVARLLTRFPQTRFEAFGTGDFENVRAAFDRHGIAADRVRFNGHVEDLPAALAECDVYINTLTRGGGLVPAQAIMAGLPAINIATVEGGYPPDGTRFIEARYLPVDLDAMEEFAARLITDAGYRAVVARDQLARLQSFHSPEKTVPVYDELARCLLLQLQSAPTLEGVEWVT